MFKKQITYTDYNGVERTETFLFNISRAELLEMASGKLRDVGKLLSDIANQRDTTVLVTMFDELIRVSYGKKSEDGKRFIKSQEIYEAFLQSEAYSELLVDLTLDADEAIAFVNGIIPTKFLAELNSRIEKANAGTDADD